MPPGNNRQKITTIIGADTFCPGFFSSIVKKTLTMKMKTKLFVLLFLLPFAAFSQQSNLELNPDSLITVIRTTDGNEFFGTVVEENKFELRLETPQLGILTIAQAQIRSRKTVRPNKIVDGELWLENSQAARYFLAPNGFGLRKGEGYYQNSMVFVNQASIGVTDHFTFGLGIIPSFVFGLNGSEGFIPTPVWITPKLSFPVKEDVFSIGVGGLLGTVLGDDNSGFGVTYGVATLGNRDRNLSVGLGYGYFDGNWADRPAITLSGMHRIGKRFYLVTENYVINTSDDSSGLVSFGGRIVWQQVSLDFGVVSTVSREVYGLESNLSFPWFGLVIPFQIK
jgi:hypothetical protein